MARKNKGTRTQRKSVYIVGEGITEQYYFHHLKRIKNYRCIVKPRLFGNTNIFEIEKKIIELSTENSDIICVFDADVSKRNQAENERLTSLKNRYATNDKINMGKNLNNACQRAKKHETGLSYSNVYKAIDRLNETL